MNFSSVNRLCAQPGLDRRASLFANLRRSTITKAAVRPLRVVLPAPLLDQDLGLPQMGEELGIEALAPERPVETLDAAVLPRLARLDRGRVAVLEQGPDLQRACDELRSVIASQHLRRSVLREQPLEDGDDALRRQRRRNFDGK